MAKALRAVVFTPYYPVSGLFRLIRDDDGLQLDFMTRIHGVRSFNGLRSRAAELELAGEKITVAALVDIIASKRSADRPRDRAVLDVLEKTLREAETARRPEGGERT
jgi:predicted nucleotidyltransferase